MKTLICCLVSISSANVVLGQEMSLARSTECAAEAKSAYDVLKIINVQNNGSFTETITNLEPLLMEFIRQTIQNSGSLTEIDEDSTSKFRMIKEEMQSGDRTDALVASSQRIAACSLELEQAMEAAR